MHHRHKIVDFLDSSGKWSFVDRFMRAMFMVAFNVSISCQGERTLGGYLSSTCKATDTDAPMLVYVTPKPGLYMLVLATFMSTGLFEHG